MKNFLVVVGWGGALPEERGRGLRKRQQMNNISNLRQAAD